MRISFIVIILGLLSALASAQENRSVDPSWLFVPESIESEELVIVEIGLQGWPANR